MLVVCSVDKTFDKTSNTVLIIKDLSYYLKIYATQNCLQSYYDVIATTLPFANTDSMIVWIFSENETT